MQDDIVKIVINSNGNNVDKDMNIKVTAVAKTPYKKTINANFHVKINNGVGYTTKLKQEQDYSRLLIKTDTFKRKYKN